MDIVGEYEYRYDRQLRSWADGRDTQKRPPILYCLRVCVSTGTKHLSKPDGSRQTTTGADDGEEHSNSIPIEEQRQPADDRGTPTHHITTPPRTRHANNDARGGGRSYHCCPSGASSSQSCRDRRRGGEERGACVGAARARHVAGRAGAPRDYMCNQL